MDFFEELERIMKENEGVLQTRNAVAAGIPKTALAEFVREKEYNRVTRGVYCSPDYWQDNLYILQLRCPRTIFSHDTALFLLDMTDREPLKYTVTAKTGYNPSHLSAEGVKVFTIKEELFYLGTIEMNTPFGHKVKTYNPERTVCDVLRSRNEMESQSVLDAVKNYVHRDDKNLHKLMEYAKYFHIDKRLNQYLEVLL